MSKATFRFSIAGKLGTSFGAIVILTAAAVISIFFIVAAARDRATDVRDRSLHIALLAKDLQIDVIQVQQWLTDAATTRGSAHADSVSEADKYAVEFRKTLADYISTLSANNADVLRAEAEDTLKSFENYYVNGQNMVAAYIDQGTDAGNRLMNQFDPEAEDITGRVDKIVRANTEKLRSDIDSIGNSLGQLRDTVLALGGLVLLISVGTGVAVIGAIVAPLRRTVEMLKDLSLGEGDLSARLQVKSKDEIGDMASYFNLTLDKIRNLVVSVKNEAETLRQVGVDLVTNMTETTAAVHQMNSNINSVQQQTTNQSASVTETNATMSHITETIIRLNSQVVQQAANLTQSSASIEEMIANTAAVSQTLMNNSDNVQALATASDQGRSDLISVSERVRQVSMDSDSLLEISSIIEDIASQTNLLSMNAAIEAAHAGDAGKGFAVVADEIRKLAESSSEQAKSISAALKEIKDSVDVITMSTKTVVRQFEDINGKIIEVSEREQNIRAAMEEQNLGGQQILESLNELKSISGTVQYGSDEMMTGSRQVIKESENLGRISLEVSGSMTEMSSGLQQIGFAMQDVQKITQRNKDSIDSLNEELGRFRV